MFRMVSITIAFLPLILLLIINYVLKIRTFLTGIKDKIVGGKPMIQQFRYSDTNYQIKARKDE